MTLDLLRLEDWTGVWSLDRRFFFETAGAPERLRGQVTISLVEPDLALYSEEGYLEGLGRPIHAVQRYWIRTGRTTEPAIELLFASDPERPDRASPFATLEPAEGGALKGRHVCGDDLYTGTYRSRRPGELDIEWIVVGPRKRGRISSELRRVRDEMGYP